LAGRIFFHFAETSIWILEILIRKYRGKDRDDLQLTLQKIFARISCALASSIAYMFVSYFLFMMIKHENFPLSLVRLFLEMIASSYFIDKTKLILNAVFPRLATQNKLHLLKEGETIRDYEQESRSRRKEK